MTGRFATSFSVSRLGLSAKGNYAGCTFPPIDSAHSIMVELYLQWDSPYIPTSYGPLFSLHDLGASQFFNSYVYNTWGYPGDVSMSLYESGWDEATRMPQPQIGSRGRDKYWVFLLDRTNSEKVLYEDGSVVARDAFAGQDPDLSLADNPFTILGAKSFSGHIILVRLTVLPSVPAGIDDMVAHMHHAPMALHADLQALTPPVAAQWSFDDVIVDNGGHSMRTVEDTGLSACYPLVASIDLEQQVPVSERCAQIEPAGKDYYYLDESHYASNGGVVGHGIAGGAHIIEVLMDLSWNYIRHGTDSHFVFLVDAGVGPIFLRQVTQANYYELGIGKWGTTYYIYENLFPFNVLHLVLDGTNRAYIDGQQIVEDPGEVPPDYSGTWPAFYLGGDLWYSFRHNVPGFRFWNYPTGVLPTGWEDEVRIRASCPWQDSLIFGTPQLEWLINDDIDPASLIIPCTGSAGAAGDLTIVPAGQFQNVRQAWKV